MDRRHRMPGRVRFLSALVAVALPSLWGCGDHPGGEPVGNRKPFVRVTGGPKEGIRTHFRVHVYWAGWDNDGVITRFEYATDPPPVFTEEEIAAPEQAPGVTLQVREGPRGNADTLRVSKTVDGRVYRFDWVQTVKADRIFEFETPEPDSSFHGANQVPEDTFSGLHTVYVRSRDNLGTYSDVDHLAFTAWTVAPESYIVHPSTRHSDVIYSGGQLRVAWGGIDEDPPTGVPGPVGFIYKLIPLHDVPGNHNVIQPFSLNKLIYEEAVQIPWTYRSAETTSVNLFLNPPQQYVFVVRAVDALGAVEPFVDWRRVDGPGNAFKIYANEHGGTPILQVSEPQLGSWEYGGGGNRNYEVEIPVETVLKFSWSASAEPYGGSIESYSWGLDVPDLDKEGPGSGWNPWSKATTMRNSLVFRTPGLRVVYFRARDENGAITLGTLLLRVFEMNLNREVLLLDDYLDKTYPTDSQHDEFWMDLLRNSGRFTDVDLQPDKLVFEAGGPGDTGYLTPNVPKLSHLGQYKLLLWSIHGDGFCLQTSFLYTAVVNTYMRQYLSAGGKLWLVGPMAYSSTRIGACTGMGYTPPDLVAGDPFYPLGFESGEFAWDFLKTFAEITNQQVGLKAEDRHWWDTFDGAEPYDTENPVFPGLDADPDKFHPLRWATNAITNCDAIFTSGRADTVAGFTGIIDSLYTYRAAGWVRRPGNGRYRSDYDGKVCATRWHDPDPDRSQGRVMWFGFPMYYMRTEQAQETFNRAIDWFREEEVGK